MRHGTLAAGLAALLAAGCGDGTGTVKGRVVENGQPKTFPTMQYAVALNPLDGDGKPDRLKTFSAVLNADGTFEVVASGGRLPAGMYQVAVQAPGATGKNKPTTTLPTVRREVKTGDNELTIDLAKPEG